LATSADGPNCADWLIESQEAIHEGNVIVIGGDAIGEQGMSA
jgi:hypothetical protein